MTCINTRLFMKRVLAILVLSPIAGFTLAQSNPVSPWREMNDSASSTGTTPGSTAPRQAGPSADYAARIRDRIRPNINYHASDPNTLRNNPQAAVQVQVAPDGTITGQRLLKSSGIPLWDNAVMRAIDKTRILPRDVDGRVFSPMIIVFWP